MSLHDILMERASMQHPEFRADYGKGALSTLWSDVADGIKAEQDKVQAKRDAEREAKTAMEQFKSFGGDVNGMKKKISYGSDGKVTVSLEDTSIDDLKDKRENRIATQQEYLNGSRLGSEFINRPEVKNYDEVTTQLSIMDNAYSSWKSGGQKSANALDQALVNTFGRMIDPGVSIREAEYQRTPDNMSLINRTDATVQRLMAGGVLNDAEREDLIKVANVLGDARGRKYGETYNEYIGLATQYGLNPTLVTRGKKPYESRTSKSVGVSIDGEPKSFKKGRFQVEVE